MANLRQVTTEDQVDREAESIKRFLKSENEPVIIAWGTAEGMESYKQQEIIEQLDTADQDIRKKLLEQTYGLGDARKKEILMQVRESVQKAITLLLSMPR